MSNEVLAVLRNFVAIAYGVMGLAIYINRSMARLLRTWASVSQKVRLPRSGICARPMFP